MRFSEKCRKGLRKFFLILGVSAVSLVFQACYGMPPDYGWEDDLTEDKSEKELSEKENKEETGGMEG